MNINSLWHIICVYSNFTIINHMYMVFYVKIVIGRFDEKCGESGHDFFKVLSTIFKDW
jgi:hypothetical protein